MSKDENAKRTDIAVEHMRRQRRARAVQALALRMVFGGERKIVISAPSQQEAATLFDDAKSGVSESIFQEHAGGSANERSG